MSHCKKVVSKVLHKVRSFLKPQVRFIRNPNVILFHLSSKRFVIIVLKNSIDLKLICVESYRNIN